MSACVLVHIMTFSWLRVCTYVSVSVCQYVCIHQFVCVGGEGVDVCLWIMV